MLPFALNPLTLTLLALAAGNPTMQGHGSGTFRLERVSFPLSGETLIGDLYLPETSSEEPLPAVIVTGAWMTVKEQMPAVYAREMAARGFITLTFDFRSWGESSGQPRSVENPLAKVEDIMAAAEFLAGRPEVDAGAIGGLGICASGAYMATAATQTDIIKSLALVAPGLPSLETVETNVGGEEGVQRLLEAAQAARTVYETTGHAQLVPAASLTDRRAAMFGVDYYTERDRGLIPAWDNTFNPASWEAWLAYDAQASAPRLQQPLLVVHSDAAAIPESAREYMAMVHSEVSELWLEDVVQFDFYDRPAPVKASAEAAASHFARTLPSGQASSANGR